MKILKFPHSDYCGGGPYWINNKKILNYWLLNGGFFDRNTVHIYKKFLFWRKYKGKLESKSEFLFFRTATLIRNSGICDNYLNNFE